jgi:peroxiredoxin
METIIRQVRELPDAERFAMERLVGHSLRENQQIIIQVMTLDVPGAQAPTSATPPLPDWTRVYEGLSDQEVADVESVILQRADLSRSSE